MVLVAVCCSQVSGLIPGANLGRLNLGFKWAPQMDGVIGPLRLVSLFAGYRVFKNKK